MQRTEVSGVFGFAQRILMNPLDRVDRVHRLNDIVHRNVRGQTCQSEPSTQSPLTVYQFVPGQLLHHFGEIARRNLRRGSDLLNRVRTLLLFGKKHHGA
jgi:hypothetical protein